MKKTVKNTRRSISTLRWDNIFFLVAIVIMFSCIVAFFMQGGTISSWVHRYMGVPYNQISFSGIVAFVTSSMYCFWWSVKDFVR